MNELKKSLLREWTFYVICNLQFVLQSEVCRNLRLNTIYVYVSL